MVKSKNISLPITSNTHQSLHNEPWTKYKLSLIIFSLSKKLQKYEVKTYDGFYPKPLLYDKRLGFTKGNPKPN